MGSGSPLHCARNDKVPSAAAVALSLFAAPARARAADLTIELVGTPTIVFDTTRDGCTPNDFPDINARAFRDAAGRSRVYG